MYMSWACFFILFTPGPCMLTSSPKASAKRFASVTWTVISWFSAGSEPHWILTKTLLGRCYFCSYCVAEETKMRRSERIWLTFPTTWVAELGFEPEKLDSKICHSRSDKHMADPLGGRSVSNIGGARVKVLVKVYVPCIKIVKSYQSIIQRI